MEIDVVGLVDGVAMLAAMTADTTKTADEKPRRKRFSLETAKLISRLPVGRRRIKMGRVDDSAKGRLRRPGDGAEKPAPSKTVSPVTAESLRARRRNAVGPGQVAVMVELVAWINESGGRGKVADRLGRNVSLIAKYLTCAVVFSESTADLWADGLKLDRRHRGALLDLAAIATLTRRQLGLLGTWEAKVRRLGKVLRG